MVVDTRVLETKPHATYQDVIDAPEHKVAWRRGRLPVLPDASGTDLPPDWVCEALTPVTRELDLTLKRRAYARAGIPHFWQIDDGARLLEAFSLEAGQWRLVAALRDDQEVCLAPFEAVAFAIAELWDH